jgi:hypothetical protein
MRPQRRFGMADGRICDGIGFAQIKPDLRYASMPDRGDHSSTERRFYVRAVIERTRDVGDGERHPVRMLMRWPLAACSPFERDLTQQTGKSLHADCGHHSTAAQVPPCRLRPAGTSRQRLALPRPGANDAGAVAGADQESAQFISLSGCRWLPVWLPTWQCTSEERLGITVLPGERLAAWRHPRLE